MFEMNDDDPVYRVYARLCVCSGEAKLLICGAGGLGFWCIQVARVMFPKTTKIFVASSGVSASS